MWPSRRGGRCAIVGRPNVGKSTLLNRILKQKLVIATPRPGTTRSAVLGVYADDETQIAFVDTPGLATPKSALHHVLVEQAQQGLALSEVVLFMVEAPSDKRGRGRKGGKRDTKPDEWAKTEESAPARFEIHPAEREALAMITPRREGDEAPSGPPVLLVINKVDRLKDKAQLLPIIEAWMAEYPFAAVVPLSAVKDKNFDGLLHEIRERLPEGVLYDDDDFITDRPVRFFAAEFVREAVIRRTREEVPYGCAVLIERYEEDRDAARIDATVVVEKDSHKGIVIGAGGKRIKEIGIEARESIEEFLGRRVHLKLFVQVQAGWTGDPNKAKRLATSESET